MKLIVLGFLKEFRPTSGEHFDTDVINTKPQSQRLTCAKNQCIKLIEYYGIDHKDEERFSLSMTDAQRLHELCSCQRKCRVQYMESKWIEVWHLVITYSCNGNYLYYKLHGGLGGSIGCASDWWSGGCGVRHPPDRQHSFVKI